jgi:hypothetical protein
MSNKVGTAAGHGVVEGGKALKLLQSTITEIIGAVQTAMGAKAMEAGLTSMISDAIKQRAIELATSALGPQFIAQATPFLGLIPNAYSAVTKSYSAVDGIVKAVHASRYAQVVKIGSPRAAAEAVATILKRKAAYLTAGATTSLANLGVGIANAASTGIATAAEVSVKIANLVIDLIAELTMFAIELYEHAAGERLLQNLGTSTHPIQIQRQQIDEILPAAFDSCPLLGCYLLGASPYFNTSDFVTLTAGATQLASVDEIERIAVKNVNPLRLYASQIITESKVKLRHEHRSDLNKIMEEAALRADAQEARSLKGRAKAAAERKIVAPIKNKIAQLRGK